MKTECLFYTHSSKYDFEAQVIDFQAHHKSSCIVLDQTYFYPEGGGQPSDRGFIENFVIHDVQIKNNLVYHYTQTPINPLQKGEIVSCHVDSCHRHHHMQQHTGQHVFSAVAFKNFNAQTLAMHIGKDYVTIDFDRFFSENEVNILESLANEMILKNLSIQAIYPRKEELDNLPLRRQPQVSENLRLIEIENLDLTPCGGLHFSSTAHVGILHIKKYEKYKKGSRFTCLIGEDARLYFNTLQKELQKISKDFSVQPMDISKRMNQMQAEIKEVQNELKELKTQLIEQEVQQILSENQPHHTEPLFTFFDQKKNLDMLRLKSNALASQLEKPILAINTGAEETHYVLIIPPAWQMHYHAGEIFKKYFSIHSIKGGGGKNAAQGTFLGSEPPQINLKDLKSHFKQGI